MLNTILLSAVRVMIRSSIIPVRAIVIELGSSWILWQGLL
jgi:hypothetical protein